MSCNCGSTHDGLSRRDLLKLGIAGAGFIALGPFGRSLSFAAGTPVDQTRLVVMNLVGGNDTLNTVIPTTLAPYYERRENLAITAAQGISMNAGPHATADYVLNPVLPTLAKLWSEGRREALDEVLLGALRAGLGLALLGAAGLLVFAGPLVAVVIQTGRFTPEDTAQVAALLWIFAFAVPA